MSQHLSMIIAGATGLVGEATLKAALESEKISSIYSLSRRPLEIKHQKLTQWLDPELTPPVIESISAHPRIGVITLGTTLKTAGSKEKLHAIDVDLVVKVTKDMQTLGVQHLIVVSSIGASMKARSHYLKCKGEMEFALQRLEFMKITFMQPGPLAGPRKEIRKGEKWLQRLLKVVNPLMMGDFEKYKLIESNTVANAIIRLATEDHAMDNREVNRMLTPQMCSLLM